MLKSTPERITLAQERLIKLINERNLRKWCQENKLDHSAVYRIALDERSPTYKFIASICHLIPPAEWFFYTDEKNPYKSVISKSKWNPDKICKYVSDHKADYLYIAKKYGMPEISAYRTFVLHTMKPSYNFIMKVRKDTDPADFFRASEKPQVYSPKRGDIIFTNRNKVLVISDADFYKANKIFVGCKISETRKNAIELGGGTKEYVSPYSYEFYPKENQKEDAFKLIDSAPEKTVKEVLQAIKSMIG